MIPKKIYINDKAWSEAAASVSNCDMQNREYIDLSQVWHEAIEGPQDNSHILIRYNYLGTMEFKSYHINYQYDLTWSELVNFQEIKYWAYIDDIFSKRR